MSIDPKGMARLERLLKSVVEEGARTGAKTLKEFSSQSGGGIHWDHLPNRSSAPGEYPAKQTGTLLRKIQMRKVSFMEARYGIVKAGEAQFNLEFFPTSMGGRAPLKKSAHDPKMHEAIKAAIRKLVL